MADRLDPPEEGVMQQDAAVLPLPQAGLPSGPSGLAVRGVVMRRTRRMVGNDEPREVVTYTLGPRYVTFEQWEPSSFHAVGEVIEVEVTPNVWNGRVTFMVPRSEEEF
jgi:hypothetical protein